MRIVILGGRNEADFVIKSFNNSKNELMVINSDEKTAKFLAESNHIEVLCSNPARLYTYENINIKGFDLVISLMDDDVSNFTACILLKKLFGVKKAICTVSNPNNVNVFNQLGIDSPISGSYLLTQRIQDESDVESLFKTMSLENEKVKIIEFRVRKEFDCVGKALKDLNLPSIANICCVFRNPNVIIPRGNTVIRTGDRLIVACAPVDQNEVISFLRKTKVENE